MKLYQALADELRNLIDEGIYRPSEKLPSLRQLSAAHGISIATAQRALEELEIRGLIEVRPKSGFYVKMPASQPQPALIPSLPLLPKSIRIHEFASQIFQQCEAQGKINLGVTYPAAHYFPEKRLQKIAAKVVKQNIPEVVEVHFSAGLAQLKKVLAKRLNEVGCRLKPSDFLVTNGCLEGLSICLRAVAKPGDSIAVESPGFVGLFQLIESLGYKAVEIPCHPQQGLSIEALELALEQWPIKAVAVVPSFSNPTGSLMPEANRKQLVELLAEHNIPLIEDDLFGDLAFDGLRPKPCKAFDKKGLVLYCSSASKTIASGLRVGWIVPGAFQKEVAYFKTFTNISAPNLTQLIVAEFLQSGQYERHIRLFTARLAQQMFRFQKAIERFFPDGTQTSQPKGGCILWVELPKKYDGLKLFEQAIKLGIAIAPGQLSSASSKYNHCIRLNCACDPHVDIEQTVKIIAALLVESES
ncbi:aminotransferase-like domain-containing protein [Aliikangiella sp. IMCC44653]